MVQLHGWVLMDSIVPLPDDVDVDPDGPMRLVRVEYESGGEDVDEVQVYDRARWLDETQNDELWRTLAQQDLDGSDVRDMDGKRLVAVELYGWWVDSEAEDADRGDTIWKRCYGDVYGKDTLAAVVDYEWSADKAAWSFPHIRDQNGRWKQPGKFGPGGPKSVMPVIFPVGTPTQMDATEVRVREAKQAAFDNDLDADYDWETAIENARERAEARASMQDEELDISAVKTLEDQNNNAHRAASKAFVSFKSQLEDELDTEVDPVTLTVASEAIAEAVREVEDLPDPRDGR